MGNLWHFTFLGHLYVDNNSRLISLASYPDFLLWQKCFMSIQSFFSVFELLKEGEVLVVPTDNPMSEKEAWLAFRDVVHGLEYRKPL